MIGLSSLSGAKRTLAHGYALSLASLVFLWPIALGIAPGGLRLAWLFSAAVCIAISIVAVFWALPSSTLPVMERVRLRSLPILLAAIVPSLVIGALVPLTFFSDEEALVLPALRIASVLADIFTWPGLIAAVALLGILGGVMIQRCRTGIIALLCVLCFLASVGAALMIDGTYGQFVRFPPVVHLVQILGTMFSMGDPNLFRFASVLWALFLAGFLWRFTPEWSDASRIGLFLAAGLTPLGWTYRILLYQAAGEIVLLIILTTLLSQFLQRRDRGDAGVLIGMLFSGWILYRPTALVLCLGCIGLLWCLRYRRAAWSVAFTALPVGGVWVLTYLLGAFQYSFLQPGSERVWNLHSVLTPLLETALILPSQVRPLGFAVLILGTIGVLWRASAWRSPLLLAWFFALLNIGLHNILTIERWYGYGRFNALLMVPLAFVVAALWDKREFGRWSPLFGSVSLALLIVATPWNLGAFLQQMRMVPQEIVERTVTGGVEPTALPGVIDDFIAQGEVPPVILSPSHAFLDLAIARGMLTPVERDNIITRSNTWTPEDAARPVIIQAPAGKLHYRGNLTEEEEKRLRDAALWARTQPGVQSIFYRLEETLIVR